LRCERGCLPERCRAAQNGYTPLLLAAHYGHAAVVEQLLAADAVTEAKDAVSGERGMRDADRAESRSIFVFFLLFA